MFINSKETSPYLLNFTFCIKSTILHGILRKYDPVRQMYIFCPLTNSFLLGDSRLSSSQYIHPIEIALQEKIHNCKFNQILYNLIQHSLRKIPAVLKEVNIIRALELLLPLLRTKSVIRMLARLLTIYDIIKTNFPIEFLPTQNLRKYEFIFSLTPINKSPTISRIVFHLFL